MVISNILKRGTPGGLGWGFGPGGGGGGGGVGGGKLVGGDGGGGGAPSHWGQHPIGRHRRLWGGPGQKIEKRSERKGKNELQPGVKRNSNVGTKGTSVT